jgi:hypothetical protein
MSEWKVEGIHYDEDQGWVVYYYPAADAAPSMLAECEYSSVGEVLKWAKVCRLGAARGGDML